MVAGIGTDVGKTVVSAILAKIFHADYWKPIQSGNEELSDGAKIASWLKDENHHIHETTYSLQAPLSPHHAARKENIKIAFEAFKVPTTKKNLIIEGVGGVLVPISLHHHTLELFKSWNCQWVIVSKHYLGSINHTLLTAEILKLNKIPILGLVFNGLQNKDTEDAILEMTKLPLLGRLFQEPQINTKTLQKYVTQWHQQAHKLCP